jgi:hypothetical protein
MTAIGTAYTHTNDNINRRAEVSQPLGSASSAPALALRATLFLMWGFINFINARRA